jgi:adenine-specific DNA-methyltransferase
MKLHWPTKSYSFTLELDANDQIVQKYWEKIEQDFTANQGKLIFEHENFPNKYKNLLFHGDNQKILTILKDHIEQGNLDRIKCIYIDPPYNTGRNDIKYHDVFEHSEWLSFMFPRLKLMREVLREDGFLIVQLDDSEHAYLDIMLSEIFGEENKMASFIWRRRQSQANLKKTASTIHDYILIYGKNKKMVKK